MSDRKFIRGAMRAYARRNGIEESSYVSTMFNRLQIQRYGATCRKINQAKGTKPRRLWSFNIKSALCK